MLWLNACMVIITSFMIKIKGDIDIFESDDRIFNEIVGGSETEPSNYPYIVTIQVGGYHYCGGSILRVESPAIILTAAHCDEGINANWNVVVRLYAKDADASYNPITNDYIETTISHKVIHPDYNSNNYDNDIMILWLNENIEWYPQLQPVIIEPNTRPSTIGGTEECCHNDEDLQVIGYGNDCSGCQNTPTLEYVDVGYIDRSTCKQYFGSHLRDSMNCAAELPHGGSDACQGDSGGPMIIAGTNKQIGVVSWGYGCATHYPGVYADVGVFYDWIQGKMQLSQQQIDDSQKKEEFMMIQNRKIDSFFTVKSPFYYYFAMGASGVTLGAIILYYYCKNREYEAILEDEKNVFVSV